MDIQRFISASNNNAKILEQCLKTNSTDLSNIQFWEDDIKGKDLSFDQLLAKAYDILACCAIGAIPSIKKTGADGFIYFTSDRDTVHEVETKLCAIESKNIHIGGRGGLYWSSDPNNYYNKAALLSHFSGKFDSGMSEETMQSKARYTSLVCFDRDQNSIIDAWIMEPKIILSELKNRQNNSTITIKLNRFMSEGTKMGTKITKLGWNDWFQQQTKLAKENKRFI